MARPRKCRRVCCMPVSSAFLPSERPETAAPDREDPIVMTIDEYEAVRLIDHEGLSQEECSRYMDVARTTVQQIYTSARKKIAGALVEARPLFIKGGDYRLCDSSEAGTGCGGCMRRCQRKERMVDHEHCCHLR